MIASHSTYIGVNREQVYNILTTDMGWNSWFTSDTVLERKVGGAIYFKWSNFGPNHVSVEDIGTILELDENKTFVFQWKPYNTTNTVKLVLSDRGVGTIVHVEEYGCNTSEELSSQAAGWGEALTLLKFYLEYGVAYGVVP